MTKSNILLTIVAGLSLNSVAFAADIKAECEAALDRDGAPAAVKAGCVCVADETSGDQALADEFLRITALPQADRMNEDSPDVFALMQKCFANPQ